MKGHAVEGLVAAGGRILVVENFIARCIEAEELGILSGSGEASDKGIINQIIERRVLVDAAANRIIDALVHLVVPNFGCEIRGIIHLIFARTCIRAVVPRRHVIGTLKTVVEEKQILIVRNRRRVLANLRESIGTKTNGIFLQGRKLVPLLGRIALNPLDRSSFIVQPDQKILAARYDYRIGGTIVGRRVVVKPVNRSWGDEKGWVIAARNHRRTDDIGQIPVF